MTEQRFDIIVQDKVAKTIKAELAAIGTAAGTTRGMLAAMRAEMASMSTGAGGLGATASTATRAMRDEAAASNALTRSLREQAKAERELASARTAANAASRAQTGAASTVAGTRPGLGGGAANPTYSAATAGNIKQVGDASKLSAQYAAQLGFQLNDVFVSLASGQKPMTVFIQQGAQIAQLPAQAGMSWKQFGAAALNTLGIFTRVGDAALDAAAAQAAASAASVASANATAAANVRAAETDVALASAQQRAAITANEQAAASIRLTAANTALAAANAEAAVTASALALAQGDSAKASLNAEAASVRGLSRFAKGGIAAIAVAAVLATTLGAITREANNDSGLKKYTTAMGYTASEVKKLNAVTVGFGDTAKAVLQVGAERVASAFGISTADIANAWNGALDWMASTTVKVMAGIYAAVAGMAYGVNNIIQNIGDGVANDNPFTNVITGYKEAYGDATTFFDDVGKKARANARATQDQMAKDMWNKPGGGAKKGGGGFDRAKELRDENAELDAQIKLLNLYGTELERANQIEQIGKKFRENNVPLIAKETAALEAKIRTLQEGQVVQDAMTAADEAANGAGRKYEATLTALDQMLDNNKLSQQQYNEQLFIATRAYDDAIDPLSALNRELQKNGELMGLYGRSKDVASYIQSLADAAEAQGKSIYQTGPNEDFVVNGRSKKLNSDAQTMVDQFQEQQKQGDYAKAMEAIDPREKQNPGDASYILDHYKDLYSEIDRLRQGDVINEEEAARRKQNVDKAYTDARLSTASTMLGQLTQLQSSQSREAQAIGKAAAIAQATIDGIRAVQAALAGPPGPPWSFAIAGVTAAMTAANVAQIAGIGFQSGGYTGNMPRDKVAGAVHGQEFVFDAAATSRLGVPALEALRSGRTLATPSNDNMGSSGGNVTIGEITVHVEGKPDDPAATGREVQAGIERALRKVARKEIVDQQRDGGVLAGGAMAR